MNFSHSHTARLQTPGCLHATEISWGGTSKKSVFLQTETSKTLPSNGQISKAAPAEKNPSR